MALTFIKLNIHFSFSKGTGNSYPASNGGGGAYFNLNAPSFAPSQTSVTGYHSAGMMGSQPGYYMPPPYGGQQMAPPPPPHHGQYGRGGSSIEQQESSWLASQNPGAGNNANANNSRAKLDWFDQE